LRCERLVYPPENGESTPKENDDTTSLGSSQLSVNPSSSQASGLFWLSKENDTWKIVAFRIEDELGSFVGGTIPGS
jgi:hypothetical protein